ncbi:MAG: helix-turn-helix transcriptional regulator, partial [Lachnospiraceae bacterium]|nr:helix-turn-helix transcriptional regulator [Lachnospiraceae bacterium]
YQRLFREAVGDSVMKYVARRRLLLAAEELAGTDESVLEIAFRYGYDSHEGFTRSFRAYMGVTPTEYRRYHLSVCPPNTKKERCAMLYSKTTGEIIRELNSLIAEAEETAADTRKNAGAIPEAAEFYSRFWDFIAARTEAMAGELRNALERIAVIAERPDEISARFRIIKAIEDTAFQASITDFEARLMISRAKPEHRATFEAICGRYDILAGNARMKSGRIAEFLQELSALIFRDMRKNAEQSIRKAAEAGRSAAESISGGPDFPYAYIADELRAISNALSSTPLEEITVSCLEEYLLRLDIIAFAADMDALRAPAHKPVLDSIAEFKKQLAATVELFALLSENIAPLPAEPEKEHGIERTAEKKYGDLVFQERILLFSLRGELQKLGDRLSEDQKAAFDTVCGRLNTAIHLAQHPEDTASGEIAGILQETCQKMAGLAEELGIYGAPIQFIAEELRRSAKHF